MPPPCSSPRSCAGLTFLAVGTGEAPLAGALVALQPGIAHAPVPAGVRLLGAGVGAEGGDLDGAADVLLLQDRDPLNGDLKGAGETRREKSVRGTHRFQVGMDRVHVTAVRGPQRGEPLVASNPWPYPLQGAIEAGGDGRGASQFAEIGRAPDIQGLLQVQEGMRHLGRERRASERGAWSWDTEETGAQPQAQPRGLSRLGAARGDSAHDSCTVWSGGGPSQWREGVRHHLPACPNGCQWSLRSLEGRDQIPRAGAQTGGAPGRGCPFSLGFPPLPCTALTLYWPH